MLNKRIIKILLGFCLLYAGKTFSQAPDTIVVYDYVRVVDTVWIEREKPCIDLLHSIDSRNVRCKPISEKIDSSKYYCITSATLSDKSILFNGNQKQTEMKRKGFFALLFVPFHLTAFGQTEISLHAGPSSMWMQHSTSTVSNPMWAGAHVGAEFCIPLKNDIFGISTGITARYVQPTNGYQQKKPIDTSLPYLEYDYAQLHTNLILNELNTGLFAEPYWQVSVPLKINIQVERWRPFVGVSYSFTQYFFDVPEVNQGFVVYNEPDIRFHDIEIVAGTRFRINNQWSLRLEGSNGLIGRHNFFENDLSPTLGVKEYFFTSLNVDLSVVWTLPLFKQNWNSPRYH